MLAREDGKEIEDVEKQILVRPRHRGDQTLVRRDHLVLIIRFFRYIGDISAQVLCGLNRETSHTYCVAELVVHVVGYHGFRHLGEVSAENRCDVVRGIVLLLPIKRLAVLFQK